MTDYGTPEARQALRREIAETLGWRVVITSPIPDDKDYGEYTLFNPRHEPVIAYESVVTQTGDFLSAAWEKSLTDLGDEPDEKSPVPDWTTDLNAAITLPLAGKDGISVAIGNGAFTVAIDPVNLMQFVISRKIKDTSPLTTQIATTICQVWLEYRRVMKTEAR